MKFKTADIITNGFYQYLILGITTCQTRYIYKILFVREGAKTRVKDGVFPWMIESPKVKWQSASGNVHQEIITCSIEAIDDMFVFYKNDPSIIPSYIGEEYPQEECQICFDPECKAPNKRSP